MNQIGLDHMLAEVLRDRRLLTHPFYFRWQAGEVELGELAAYAGQYRHFEVLLPDVLEIVAAAVEEPARTLVRSNLYDERGGPVTHVALFDQFASAVGCDDQVLPTPATAELVDLYRDLALADPLAGLGAVAAYEVQSADIARSKGEGLRRHYDLDGSQVEFWDVHSTADVDHAGWTLDAISALTVEADWQTRVISAAGQAADAWWAFLDERQGASPLPTDRAA
jgi:pyrroloquinoline-quinone synthase